MIRTAALSLLLVVSCTPTVAVSAEEATITTVLGAKGLFTSPSQIGLAPPGSAVVADNIVVPRPGVYETRRGYEDLTGIFPGGVAPQSLVEFKGYLIGWAGTTLAYNAQTGAGWVAFIGSYAAPLGPNKDSAGELVTGRVRFHETGGSLYFTTSKGVFRLETPTGTPLLSGISQALPGTAALTGSSGFLADGTSVAYRETWSKRTPDNRIIEGAPSGRATVFNTVGGAATRNVLRTIPIPSDLPPDAFLRVWRTESFPNALGPGEDYAQVHEKALADMPAGATSYTFTDITPDAIRGDAAYFSANLGDGLVSSKYRPPLSTDVLTFRDSTVFMGAQGLESVAMTLLSVTSFTTPPGFVLDGLKFIFSDGDQENYFAVNVTPVASNQFQVFTSGTPAQNIELTTLDLIRAINANPTGRLRGAYLSDANGTPGSFQVEARDLDEPQFTVRAIGTAAPWIPALKINAPVTFSSKTAGVVTATTSSQSGVAVGQVISILSTSNATDFPLGNKTVTSTPTTTSFTYAEPGADVAVSASGLFSNGAADLLSEHQGGPAFIAWSPLGEPDAVPVLQYVKVGKDENPVLGGLVLGNSLYIRKADGLYRLAGDVPATFALDQVDTTVSFIAPWAAFTLGGNAYALTTEGLKTWTETGKPQPASVPEEARIRDIIVQNKEAVNLTAFAVNYESERTMLLWLPSETDSTTADFAYRYNYLTDAWTTESTPAYAAVVSPTSDKLIVSSDVTGQVHIERKTRTAADYQGPDGEGIPASLTYSPQLGSDASLGKNFNRMRYHLDPSAPVPTTVDVTFATDWTPDVGTVTISTAHVRGHTLETLVTPNQKRGTRLYVGVQHDTPGEKLSILGYTVSFYEHEIGTL